MPIHDFRCTSCKEVHTELVKSDVTTGECPKCGNLSRVVFLVPPKLDWTGMAMGENAGPEFVDRFEKMHKKQAEKESAFEREHGEGEYYNTAPGG